MKGKFVKFILFGVLFLVIVAIGFIVYSSNRSTKEVPKRAKLVELWDEIELKG